jgi:hypothetical protein
MASIPAVARVALLLTGESQRVLSLSIAMGNPETTSIPTLNNTPLNGRHFMRAALGCVFVPGVDGPPAAVEAADSEGLQAFTKRDLSYWENVPVDLRADIDDVAARLVHQDPSVPLAVRVSAVAWAVAACWSSLGLIQPEFPDGTVLGGTWKEAPQSSQSWASTLRAFEDAALLHIRDVQRVARISDIHSSPALSAKSGVDGLELLRSSRNRRRPPAKSDPLDLSCFRSNFFLPGERW